MTDLGQLRSLVMATLDAGASDAIRSSRAREAVEQAQDLADFARMASGVLGGSAAVDLTVAHDPAVIDPTRKRPAADRMAARAMLDQLRASQLTSDTPGLLPRPVELGRGGLGQGDAFPIVRRLSLTQSFGDGGTNPKIPGFAAGNVSGGVLTEGTAPPFGAATTINDVSGAGVRRVAYCVARISRQVRDWGEDGANALVDQLIEDVADREAETAFAASLISAAGGTRVAGADVASYGLALDAAEKAAAAAVNGLVEVVLVNPADVAKTRRAVAQAWTTGPHPAIAPSSGVPAGTALVLALAGVHLFVAPRLWAAAETPSSFGVEVGAFRPIYHGVRAAAAIQTVTAV